MNQEPQGVEVFRTIAKLGLDVQPAVESAEELAAALKKTDTALQHLTRTAKTASMSLNDVFAKRGTPSLLEGVVKDTRALTATLGDALKQQVGLFAAAEKEKTQLLQEMTAKRVLAEQAATQKILENEKRFQDAMKKQASTLEGAMTSRSRKTPWAEAFGYRTSWFLSGTIFYGSIRGAQAIIDIAADVEEAMLRLRSVMDEQETNFASLQESIFNTAKAYGQLATRLTEASVEWAKQGKTQQEIQELLRPTALLANVGDIENLSDSVRLLTAALKQFNMPATEAMTVIDKWTSVADATAVSVRDLGEAMAVAGKAGYTVGVTFDQMAAHAAALGEATGKAGATVGQSLKTVYSYLYRPETIKFLEQMGFKVREDADTYRAFGDILADIAARWNKLTNTEQHALAMKAAGARRISDFIALVTSYNRVVEAQIVALASAGSAERKNAQIMESYNKQVEQLKASIQELCVSLGEAGLLDVLKGVTQMSSAALENFKHWPPALKTMVEALGMLAGFLTAVNMAGTFFTGKTLIEWIGKGDAAKGLATLKGLVTTLLATPWGKIGAAVVAAGAGYGIVSGAIKQAKEHAEELAKDLEAHYKAYNSLNAILSKAQRGTIEFTVASREMQKVLNSIGERVPHVVEKWDDMGNALEINTQALEKFIDKQKELSGMTLPQARQQLDKLIKERDEAVEMLSAAQERLAKATSGAERIGMLQTIKALEARIPRLNVAIRELVGSIGALEASYESSKWNVLQERLGGPQQPWYIDPKTGKKVYGIMPMRETVDIFAEPKLWESSLDKEIPAIARARDAIEQLADAEKALSLRHERELALLPAYATTLDEVTLKIRQNAEAIKQEQQRQTTLIKVRSDLQKALDRELATQKELEKKYNDLQREVAGLVDVPEETKEEISETGKALDKVESTIKSLKAEIESINDDIKDSQNTIKSLTTEGIKLDKERNSLIEQYSESLKKATQALQDMLNTEKELSQLRSKAEWARFLYGAESPEAYEAERAILVKERDAAAEELQRIDEQIKDKEADLAKITSQESRLAVQAEIETLRAKRVQQEIAVQELQDKIDLLDAQEKKRQEDRAKETARRIAENELTIRETVIQKQLAETEAAMAKEDETSQKYFELAQKRDNLLIEQRRINIERLQAKLKEAEPLDVPEIEAQIAEEEGEITKLQAGILARADEFAKNLAAKNKEIDLAMLELTDPIKAALAKVDEDVEKAFEGITDRDLDKERMRLAGYWEVWKKAAEEEATKILEDVHLAPFDKLRKLQELNAQLMAKSLDGVSGSPVIKDAINRLASEIVDAQNAAIRERAEAEGWGLDLALADIAVSDKDEAVKKKLRREAIERYVGEDLSRITSSLVLNLDEQLQAVQALLDKYAAFKEEAPEAYASIVDAQTQLTEKINAQNAELEEQRLAIQKAGLDTYADSVERASAALEEFNTQTQGQARSVELVNKEIELTNTLLGKTQAEYDAISDAVKGLARDLGQPLLQKLVTGEGLTPAEGEELEKWQQSLTPAQQATYKQFMTLLGMLPRLRAEIVRLSAAIANLNKEANLIPVQDKFAALNASLDEFSRRMAETALAEEYFADGLFADVKRMELLRQKMQATKEVAEAYRDALKTTTDKLKELLPQDAALFDAIASGLPLTKEQAERWGELNARLDAMPDAVKTLLPLLTSLRDKNGEVSKSILDQAFALYRATLAAKGLAKAYDAVVSGVEELRDQFDYRPDLRAMESRYNFNYLFGRPAERAMEDWQAEFDAIRADMEAIARISAGVRVLGSTQEDEKALAKLKEELKKLAETQPALGLTEEQIEAFGTDAAQAMEVAATAAGNLEGRLESLVSRRYFLELAREAEEMGKMFEQNIEGAFERALSDLISGKGDLLNILATFGQTVVSNMADMLAKGLTRRIFGDPNDPNSLAGRITAWATGQAGDALGIQTSMTTGAQIVGTTIETSMVRAGQTVASMWTTALSVTGGPPVVQGIPGAGIGLSGTSPSVAGWRMLEAASMAGASAITMPGTLEDSIAGWRMLETASMAGTAGAAGGGGGFLASLLGGGGAALMGFDPVTMLATFTIATIMSGIQKKLSQPLAPKPQDQYVYRITSPEFNPFASPERVYYAGTGRENVEVRAINLNFAPGSINVKDGTDVGRKIAEGIENYWGRIRTINRSGTWRTQR